MERPWRALLLRSCCAGLLFALAQAGARAESPYRSRQVLPETATGAPALVNIEDRLMVLAWTGTDFQRHLNLVRSADGRSFFGKVILRDTSIDGPALAIGNGRLYLAWTGTDAGHHLNVMSSSDLVSFRDKVTLVVSSPYAPALAFAGGRLVIAWVSNDARHTLNLASSMDGVHFGNLVTLPESSDAAPSLAVAGGRLHLLWVGRDVQRSLNAESSADGVRFEQKVTFRDSGDFAPVMIQQDRVWIAWTGRDAARRLNLLTARTGGQGDLKRALPESAAAAPALVAFRGAPYLAWTAGDGSARVVIAQLADPAGAAAPPSETAAESAPAATSDPVAPYRVARESFQQQFRVTGAMDPAQLTRGLGGLEALAARGDPEVRVRALQEIGYIRRFNNANQQAAASYRQAAELAESIHRPDLAFEAWAAAARALNGAKDHGAAQLALDRANATVGGHPSADQRREAADTLSGLADARGETETALVAAIDARRLAQKAEDRFYAELDAADDLEHLVESCDYRPLRDSRSGKETDGDGWGACRRAIAVAKTVYAAASRTAEGLGWHAMSANVRGTGEQLSLRLQLLEMHAKSTVNTKGFENDQNFVHFTPQRPSDVLVEKGEFERQHLSASMGPLNVDKNLIALATSTIALSDRVMGKDNADVLALRGDAAQIAGGSLDRAADLSAQAADRLMAERASYFDARRRGTVMERQGTLLGRLALRELALKHDDAAFAAYEMGRARGLGELAQALAHADVSAEDRAWLAEQVRLDALANSEETLLAEKIVGEGQWERSDAELTRWEDARTRRDAHLRDHKDMAKRLMAEAYSQATLAQLKEAVARSGIAVLFYWIADPNVYIWCVGPHGSDFRAVFLPETELRKKVERLMTMSDPNAAFDAAVARQLYLYLVGPVEDLLGSKQVMIVPQGVLVGLPFESLINPGNGQFVIDRWIVSYAPNATMARQALNRVPEAIRNVTAVVDLAIDDETGETRAIAGLGGLQLHSFSADDVMPDKLVATLGGVQAAHVLMHGAFNATEPLLSTLQSTVESRASVNAATLLGLPLRGTRLVVMSACESGELQHRISNEMYGFPSVLLAAGAHAAVTSRWRVEGSSNSQWMAPFYAALAGGASPAEAAAAAMRAMLRKGDRQPHQWAAMQVVGR